jgi:hypothetical protein
MSHAKNQGVCFKNSFELIHGPTYSMPPLIGVGDQQTASMCRLLGTTFSSKSGSDNRGHSRLGYYFWDKGLKDYVVVDLGVYHDLLLFDQ